MTEFVVMEMGGEVMEVSDDDGGKWRWMVSHLSVGCVQDSEAASDTPAPSAAADTSGPSGQV